MKLIDIETTTKTTVSYNGMDINEVLRLIAEDAHDALIALSEVRQRNDLPEGIFDKAEGSICRILDILED